MSQLDPTESFEALKAGVQNSIKKSFPQEGEKHILDLEDIEITDSLSSGDYKAQKEAKVGGRTFGIPVHGTLVLKDKETGKVIERKRQKIATLPKITNRYSYIVEGSEFQVDNQWRLKPGVYTKVKDNGELDSFFNIKGRPLHVGFDPKSRAFNIQHGGSKPPLYPVMKALGVSDDTLERSWGKEILESNRTPEKKTQRTVINLARRLDPRANVEDYDQAAAVLQEKFKASELSPEVTQRTLGKPINHINHEAFLRSSQRLLGISRGTEKPDVRDSLMFKELHGVEDLISERITGHQKTIARRIGNNLDRKETIREIVAPDVFNRPVKEFFGKVSLANTPQQTNPLRMIGAQMRTTITGEGGVGDPNRISDEAKLLDPSHFAVLDPLQTPEGAQTGVSLQLALGARKKGNTVTIPLINAKTGKREMVDTAKVYDSTVALPDDVQQVGGKFVPKKGNTVLASIPGNEMRPVKMKDVQYVVPKPSQMFSLATNMVPFLNSDSPNRATMAGRHMEQAIPVDDGEAPLVQATISGKPFDDLIGSFSSHHAPVDGKVVGVTEDAIVLQDQNRKKVEVPIYNYYPLNDKKGFAHSKPQVKVGDQVKKGQLIGDTNFTRAGTYAPGKNLKIAYMPWKGLNFEDGVVVSQTAAQKMTSSHLYKKGLSTRDAQLEGKKKYQAYYNDRLPKTMADKLDDDGVIKPGQILKPGDTMVAALAPRELTTEHQKLNLLHKSIIQPKEDKALKWEEDYEGEVVGVHRRKNKVEVHVKTREPMEVGDKLTARHANKGIITSVLPDSEMPKDKDGNPMELLMNPVGTPGRLNVGQVLETAASKVALKTGKPFTIENFTQDDNLSYVKDALKREGLSDKEDLIDPHTGKTIPGIQTGQQYIFKMEHQVSKKLAARSRDAYDQNMVPRGGGKHGAQSLGGLGTYAMLAHGARANLSEMISTKSDKSQGGLRDEVWSAIQTGDPIPPPKPTFAYEKFNGYLKTMGVDVQKKGNSLNLIPMTDKQVEEMSSGELKDPGRVITARTLKPEKGGLFDEEITGGLGGTRWGHIKIQEPMPNPLFEKAIMSLTGMRKTEFNRIVEGEAGIKSDGTIVGPGEKDARYGPQAIGTLIDKIDVDKQLKEEEARIGGLRDQPQNESRRRIKYLRNLKKLNMTPRDAYMVQNVPVLPPAMRPLAVMDDGSLQNDDLNELYKQLGIVNSQLGKFPQGTPDSVKLETATSVYDHLRSLTGTGGALNAKHPGIITMIAGKKGAGPKAGYAQGTLLKRKQDLTMRSTIVPEPSLDLDEVMIPRKGAKEMYKPFVVQELRSMTSAGPLAAKEMIDKDDPMAQRALERVIEKRPLLLKRDPVLHRYGIQAFKPKLTDGKAIKIHPLVCSGYNADFNGDSCKPSESLMIRFQGRLMLTTFGELAGILLPDSTEEDRVALAAGGTAILGLSAGLEVLSWIPGVGVRWRPAREFTIHTSHGAAYEVTTHIGRRVSVSEHHNFGVVGQDLVWRKVKTDEMARGMLVPFIRKMPLTIEQSPEISIGGGLALPNDFKGGWFCGYFSGDGSVTGRDDTLSLACGDDALHPLLGSILEHVELPWWDEPGRSVRSTNKRWAMAFKSLFGHTAPNKRVPNFVFEASEDFRNGFIAGLIDAEGSIQEDKNGAAHVRIEVTSSDLLDGTCWLLESLGIGAYRRHGKKATSKTKETYTLEISRDDLWLLPSPLFECKAEVLHRLIGRDRYVVRSRYDLVPFSSEVVEALARRGKRGGLREDRSGRNYRMKEIRKYGELGYITRNAAERVIWRYGRLDDPAYKRWLQFVDDKTTSWTLITSIGEVERPRVMYDFSVPEGNETFAVAGGLITRNTMSAYVPLSAEAVKEAEGMFPSRNLFSPATRGVMYQPTHEQQVGLFMATQAGSRTNKSFKDPKELEHAFNKGEVKLTDVVRVGGTRTTLGRMRIDQSLPKPLQGGKVLKDLDYLLTKKEQGKLFDEAARADAKSYANVANTLKNIGNETASTEGFSFGLDDFKVHKDVRDPILRQAAQRSAKLDPAKPKDVEKIVDIYGEAMGRIEKGVKGKAKQQKTQLDRLEVAAGIKGNGYRQLTAAPVLFVDGTGEVVPNPVERSFSEGLTSANYWAATSGGRKGIIQKVQSVREPGYLTKMMVNSVIDTMVDTDDCGTDRGINLSVDEPDVIGRYTTAEINLGGGKKLPVGTLVTPEIATRIKNAKSSAKVVVRSPMRCNHGHGICAKCAGLDENGRTPDKGTNVGILAAQALGERGTQLAMKSFHCLHPSSVVTVCSRYETKPRSIPLEQLFELIDGPLYEDEDGQFKVCFSDMGWLIYDGTGWSELQRVRRHAPSRPLVMVSDGVGVTICQENHPIMARVSLDEELQAVEAGQLIPGRHYVQRAIVSNHPLFDLLEEVSGEHLSGSYLVSQVVSVLDRVPWVYDVTTQNGLFVAGGLLNHNSGGVYEGKDTSGSLTSGGLDRAVDLLYLPQKLKGSATLATSGGRIKKITKDPAGGYRVRIGDTEEYIPANRTRLPNVKVGQTIKKGAPLTRGPVNPHELLPLVGMSKTQGHLAGELHNVYGKYGIQRRHSETLVRAVSGATRIEENGDNPDYLPGDYATGTQVYDWNRKHKGAQPIKHSPILRGVKQLPLDTSEDWLARLNHERLKDTLVEGAQQGWSSELHGTNPVPSLIQGAEFGKGTDKKPWRY